MKFLVIGAGRMSIGLVHDFLSLKQTTTVHVTDRDEAALTEMRSRFDDPRLKLHRFNADDQQRLTPLRMYSPLMSICHSSFGLFLSNLFVAGFRWSSFRTRPDRLMIRSTVDREMVTPSSLSSLESFRPDHP